MQAISIFQKTIIFLVLVIVFMKDSKNPSSIRSKKEITDALMKLMHDHPFSEISVKQIVLETNLERKTFYNNFSSKDDVLDSIINSAIYEYVQALTKSADGPLTVIFDFCDKNRGLSYRFQYRGYLECHLQMG
jgi:Transcriptional regulator